MVDHTQGMQQLIQKVAEQAQLRQSKEQQEKTVEILTRVTAAAYDRAMAYTNIIIIAGFASAFTIWNFMRDHLSASATRSIAILLTISAAVFVAFETYKMIINSRLLFGLHSVIRDGLTPEKFQEALAKHQMKEARTHLVFARIWVAVLLIVVSTGYGAVGILVFQFLKGLIDA